MLTPKTMPVGKMIPHAMVWIKIWVHRIESMGSTEMAWPSSMLSVWWSCAVTTVLKSKAAVATALAGSPIARFAGWREGEFRKERHSRFAEAPTRRF
jgi:hypothetical protein